MIWMLTVLILLISGEFLETVESTCTLNNNQYSEGEKWNPILKPFGTSCVECVCEKGEVKCTKTVTCPPVACVNPKTDPRMCCPVCEVDSDTKNKGDNNRRECTYDGKKYSHGDIFPSNSTGIIPTSKSQCVNCACTNGQVFCHLKTCDIPKGCTKLIPDKTDCCPQCADEPGQTTKESFDCEAHDGIHKNNTVWNPVVGGIKMPCLTCQCLNGTVDCQKVECPKLSCKRTRKVKGQCCEICKGKRRKKKKGRKEKKEDGKCKNTKSKKRKRKNKKGRKKGRRRKTNNKGFCLKEESKDNSNSLFNSSLPILFPKRNGTQSCVFKNLCLPRKTKYLVYRHFEDNFKAFFAFDDLKSDTVEVWSWTVNQTEDAKSEFKHTISNFQEIQYPARLFRQQINDDKIIFGAARNKKLRNFKRRLKRTYQRCIEADPPKRCTTKILLQEILCADFEEIQRKCKTKP